MSDAQPEDADRGVLDSFLQLDDQGQLDVLNLTTRLFGARRA